MDHYPAEYFKQLTSEKLVRSQKNGVMRREYVKIRLRNEALDCRVYALAALQILNPNFYALKNNLIRLAEAQELDLPVVKTNGRKVRSCGIK